MTRTRDAFYLKLKYGLNIPEDTLKWIDRHVLDDAGYQKHLGELQRGYAHYCHWRSKYESLPGIKYNPGKSDAAKVATYIIKNIKGNISDEDKEYFSVYLKIALDEVLEDHWKKIRNTTTTTLYF